MEIVNASAIFCAVEQQTRVDSTIVHQMTLCRLIVSEHSHSNLDAFSEDTLGMELIYTLTASRIRRDIQTRTQYASLTVSM